jgi:aspartyl-tRNA(Asn)/glutamyl-tRNA(Gln) amidotransferase subunit A
LGAFAVGDELTSLTIAKAAERIRAKTLSPVELTEAYLERIERLNPSINAYVTVTADRARGDARRAAEEIAAGNYRGPLHGIPVALKDLYDTAGIRTTMGSIIYKDYIPEHDSTAARLLREAGSVLLGKTNTHEFAWGTTTNNPYYGATHNPWDLDRIPGGSSGGSGAAIAARMAAGTLGTDTGGSIRIPAALCGCVGLKPTFGRASKAGVAVMSYQFDHPGPITQTVEDAAIMLQAIAGYDPADFATVPIPVPDYRATMRDGIRGLRVGVPRALFFGLLQDEVRAAVEQAIEVLSRLGAEVREVDLGLKREAIDQAFDAIVGSEGQEYHRTNFSTRPQDFGAHLRAVLSSPLPDAVGLARAYRSSYEIKERFRAALQEVDLLLAPTTLRTASIIGEDQVIVGDTEMPPGAAFAGLTLPFNIAGLPTVAIPCGFDAAALPISVQLAGRPFDESTVIRAAYAFEQATEWHKQNPPSD